MSIRGDDLEFEWDEAKARANLRKHKVDFADAIEVFKDEQKKEQPDPEPSERRWQIVGGSSRGLLFVVYTRRGRTVRIITARRATTHERRRYYAGEDH